MSKQYTVMVVGAGKRGMHHATAFNANPKFKVTGICDIDQARLDAAAAKIPGIKTGTDAAALAKELKPDVFCFCTMPNLRIPMLKAGIEGGAKLIAFEKPVALTSTEIITIRDMLDKAGAKAVVSHQHRYGAHYRKIKEIVESGALGRIQTVYGSATGWMTHMLSHLIDYTRWYAGNPKAEWVMAQAAGRAKLGDNHPSPDYIAGFVQFEGGIRGIYECGAGAPDQPEVGKWWGKCRMSVQGTEGFAEVLTNGGWRACTKTGGYQSGEGAMNYDLDMPPYIQEMAEWLDDDSKKHQNCFENAYAGAEIMLAMQQSATLGGQVALPLTDGANEQKLLQEKLADKKVIVSFPANAKEFGLA